MGNRANYRPIVEDAELQKLSFGSLVVGQESCVRVIALKSRPCSGLCGTGDPVKQHLCVGEVFWRFSGWTRCEALLGKRVNHAEGSVKGRGCATTANEISQMDNRTLMGRVQLPCMAPLEHILQTSRSGIEIRGRGSSAMLLETGC